MTHKMRTYSEIRERFGNVLPTKMAKVIATVLEPHNSWFVDAYQSKVKGHGDTISIEQLLDAVHSSEDLFQQYPADRAKVRAIADSIFVDDEWLKKQPEVAHIEDFEQLFIVGGRHRTYAIVAAVAQMCSVMHKMEEDAEDAFEVFIDADIRVDLSEVPDKETLVALIKADNDARTMRGAELAHIKAQLLGVGAEGTDGLVDSIVGNETLAPKEAISMVAQLFTRRGHKKLKKQTLQVIGEKVAAYVLYDVKPGDRLARKSTVARSKEDVSNMMNQAYNVLCEMVENMEVVARQASEIATQVIEQLGEPDDLFAVSHAGSQPAKPSAVMSANDDF